MALTIILITRPASNTETIIVIGEEKVPRKSVVDEPTSDVKLDGSVMNVNIIYFVGVDWPARSSAKYSGD